MMKTPDMTSASSATRNFARRHRMRKMIPLTTAPAASQAVILTLLTVPDTREMAIILTAI